MAPGRDGPSEPDRRAWWPPGKLEQPRRQPVRRRAPVRRPAPSGVSWPAPGVVHEPALAAPRPVELPPAPGPALPAPVLEPVASRRWTDLVDLHTHVLPGVDDGAGDAAASLAMLRAASADGIRTVVATPHSGAIDAHRIGDAVARLGALAETEGIPVTVLPGSEVRLEAGLAERYRAGDLVTLNGTYYLLLELPLHGDWPPYLLDAVYELQVEGIAPILAHAERYPAVQEDPDILIELIVRGVLIQVNATSLLEGAAPGERRTAEYLVRTWMAHLIASDAHDLSTRPPRLRRALDAATLLVDEEHVGWMVEAAAAVVAGEGVAPPDPRLPSRSSLLQRVRRG
ncbi:MAG TPA: CpsB/CapC family capsule biosynthesis tyrosine phosphatase [Thermomicrobiaceae bacterium]|nr:CpsB/CapC family capsule biosynthesis tyrosine phosphatase [Thermomicrobiaceae bacterium]